MLLALGTLTVSFVLLIGGAEILVRGASRLARRLGLSSFAIGVTVVGFGTSTPELAASVASARSGHGEIALGNVVGSNIMNIALVLGVCAMLRAIPLRREQLSFEVWTTIAVSTLPFLALFNHGQLDQRLGLFMILGLAGFIWASIRRGASEPSAELVEAEHSTATQVVPEPRSRPKWVAGIETAGQIISGLLLLAVGADWLVGSATSLARGFGVSEFIIGLTIVAGGTSAPELVTSLVAIRRGESDLGVGNILGSCVFNILGILGITVLFAPIEIPVEAFRFDLPAMLLTAVICGWFMLNDREINKLEGAFLTAIFVVYTVMLFAGWPYPADRSGGTAESSIPVTVAEPTQPVAASIQAPPSTSSPS